MREVIEFHRESIAASTIHERLELKRGRYFTVSLHREENVDEPAHLRSLVTSLNALATRYRHPLIFSTHPRTRNRLQAGRHRLHKLVRSMPPLGFFDYVALQQSAFCTLSDSGTITEESTILGFPAVNVRQAHERPEGMDEGAVVMTGPRRHPPGSGDDAGTVCGHGPVPPAGRLPGGTGVVEGGQDHFELHRLRESPRVAQGLMPANSECGVRPPSAFRARSVFCLQSSGFGGSSSSPVGPRSLPTSHFA
jgi:hypothetical protein